MEKQKFWYCPHCTNLLNGIANSGVNPVCCGDNMIPLVANSTEASVENHTPAIERNGTEVKVTVGAPHPMVEGHWIQTIMVQQGNHIQRVDLKVTDGPPIATFTVKDASAPVIAYEHCNLHGLWTSEG